MPKDTISIKLNCTPEIYRIIMRRQAKEKEKRCRVFSLEAAALRIIEESETKKTITRDEMYRQCNVTGDMILKDEFK